MNNRENLLDQALQMFATRGYDAVGVQEIVEAAGVQKPTLYHYFGSKKGLLGTLLAENFEPFFEQLGQAAFYQGDVTLSLRKVAAEYFAFAGRNPRLYRFYLAMWMAPLESEVHHVSKAFTDRQQAVMEALFTAAAVNHGNMMGRHRAYAASFLGMLNTYIMFSLNGFVEFNDELVNGIVHQFMHGIFS